MYLTTAFVDTCVYWGPGTTDGYGGRDYATPVEITGRYIEKNELFIKSTERGGKDEISNAVFFTGSELEIDGVLYKGELSDLTVAQQANPKLVDGAYIIQQWKRIQSIQGHEVVRKVWL